MTKAALSIVAATGLVIGLAAPATPALAQAQGGVMEVVVFGNDPCPRSTEDEVVVCARKPEADRYRIPERFRTTGPRQSREAWANRAKSFEIVGRTGIQSCSAVGPGGHTGCLERMIEQAKAEAREELIGATPPQE